jgi:NADH-quinone oxidoreductase subunit L
MLELLWLIPALPFAGFLALALAGSRLSRINAAVIGVGTVCASAILATLVAIRFIGSPPTGHAYSQTLWAWVAIGGFAPTIAFYLDSLSLVMMLVITVVGFLIHLYSAEFMIAEEGYSRFFAYMNLLSARC